MKHDELKQAWSERFESVKSPHTSAVFQKNLNKIVKETGVDLTDEDLAVISEIHKKLTDYRVLDESMREEEKTKEVLQELNVIGGYLNKIGKEYVAAELDCGLYDNYPYPKEEENTKDIVKEAKKEMSGERKNAKEIVMESRKEIADKILDSMKSGELMWRKDWQKLSPYNGTTGKNYHGINQIRLFVESVSRGLEDPRFMTYKQAEEKGYNVKKGAQGIMLENWQFYRDQPVKDVEGNVVLSDDGEPVKERVKLEKPIVSYFRVFSAEDINGIEPLPKLDVEREPVKNELINNVLASSRCEIKEELQDRAYYNVSEDKIVIPPRENFVSLDAFLATALHEMAHSTGHESCLNRELVGQFGSKDYAKEELRAELGSAFAQAGLGVSLADIDIENHGAYIQNWINVLENNYNEFFMAVSDADRIAYEIETNYENYCVEQGLSQEKEKTIGLLLNKDGLTVTLDGAVASFKNNTDKSLSVDIDGASMVMKPEEELKYNTKSPDFRPILDVIMEKPDSLSVVEVMDTPEKNKNLKKDNTLALAE